MFRSVEDPIATIERYIASTNDDPKPFVWTASAASIMAKLKLNQPNDSELAGDLRLGQVKARTNIF